MKTLYGILTILMLTSMSTCLRAQVDEENEPPLPPKRTVPAKLGGAAGFTSFWLFLNVDELNKYIDGAGGATFSKDGMALYGGHGYGYVLFVPNLRIGWMGASGTRKSIALDQATNTRRDINLSVGFGGATFEYVLPVVRRLDLTAGMLLGGGSLDLKMTRDQGNPKVWGDIWTEFGGSQNVPEFTRELKGSFFVYQPSLSVEYSILRWLGFRAGVSYLGMAGAEWKLDDKYDVLGVPDAVSGKGWMINAGIYVGTFMF